MSASPQFLQAVTYPYLHTSSDRKLIIPKAAPAMVGWCWLLESSFLLSQNPSTPIFWSWFYCLVLLTQRCIYSFDIVTLKDQTLILKILLGFPFAICLQNQDWPSSLPCKSTPFCYGPASFVTHILPTFLESHDSTYPLTSVGGGRFAVPEKVLPEEAGSQKAVCSKEPSSGLNHNTAFGVRVQPLRHCSEEGGPPT